MGNKKPTSRKAAKKKQVRSPRAAKQAAATEPTPVAISTQERYLRMLRYAVKWFAIPMAIYLVFFALYAWTWMGHFNTRFFTDQGDGFQNVWNMWWVNKSVTELHQLPWHTMFLHAPYGTTLIGQTLNPFNGFVAIPLLQVLSLVQAFNITVIFSFVFGGVTAFWLCHYFSRKYVASLIGGFIFTFSSYHFAHAIGHMQLVSLEFIPLFILLWWKLLTKPRYRLAVGAAITLLLVLLCDYYYFMYSVVAAGMIAIYLWRTKQLAPIKLRASYRPWAVFLALAAVLVAPLPIALLKINAQDPLLGSHDSRLFSTDLFSTVLNGGFWHFAHLTNGYWHNIKAYIAESSVYFGVSVIALLVIAVWKRNKLNRHVTFWLVLGGIFGVLSLGPRLMVFGYSINHAPLPYALLERLLPQLKLSGVPNRMIVMSSLAAAVIAAIVLAHVNLRVRKGQVLAAAFFAVLLLEMWPGILPMNIASDYPKYVNALAKLPYGTVMDDGAPSDSFRLYNQTITGKPIAFGYISRTPTSVYDKDWQLTAAILRGEYPRLCSEFKVRYFTTPVSRRLDTTYPVVYQDKETLIYDLKDSANC